MISANPQRAWGMRQLGALPEGSKSPLFGLERPNLRTRCLFPKAMRAGTEYEGLASQKA